MFLLALMTGFSLFKMTTQTPYFPKLIGKDSITVLEKETAALKTMLTSQSTVGYIDESLDKTRANEGSKRYYQLQYTLAPIAVIDSAQQKYIISFRDDKRTRKLLEEHKAKIVRMFKNGMVLLKKTSRT